MKKTKKAMLAALAFTFAIAGGGLVLAACNDNGGSDNEPTAHSHSWSNWVVEDENKPSAESGGKATRNCNGEGECDAETSDTEYSLPALNGSDYTVSNDTAQVGVSGTGKYTYDNNGVKVEFIAATPAKPHVHSGTGWTVTDENQPTADSKGLATRVCTATDDFCDWTEDDLVYELPELKDTDYSVNVKSTATCLTQGETEYTFNKDGVNVTFTVVSAINPKAHTLTKHNASEADCGSGKDGNIEYYSCECGKLFRDAEGQEEIDSVSDTVIPYEHTLSAVAANANSESVNYPDGTATTFRNMAHYECGDCGKLFKDENGENEVTSVFALTRCGMLLSYGDNLVDATDVA
ncbi:MAG: hypothetical protein K2N52_01390, partial [Clostridia bacterium]|nr:hypothetical protein [Clostridia bacterium]